MAQRAQNVCLRILQNRFSPDRPDHPDRDGCAPKGVLRSAHGRRARRHRATHNDHHATSTTQIKRRSALIYLALLGERSTSVKGIAINARNRKEI
jgi:hypothetical protein